MTREQLDAIRARYADEPLLGEMRTDKFGNLITVTREHPVVALLAEVERLTADPLPAAAWVREVEQAAFARGVESMREAAASHFSVVAPYDYIAPRIRALPDPEDKS